MTEDRKLDPVSADFVSAAGGAYETCDVVENQIAFSLLVPRGSWEGDPELGHGLAELDRAQNTVENRNRLRDIVATALQWLIDLGSIERVDVTVETRSSAAGMDGVAWEVDYYTPGAQKPKTVGPFLISVGGG